MAISLTSSGLYLEPRMYFGGSSGNVYGVPRVFAENESVSGLSGSWSGSSFSGTIFKGVTSASSAWEGYSSEHPNNFESKGGSINGYILKFRRITSKLSDLCLYFSSKRSSWVCSNISSAKRVEISSKWNLGLVWRHILGCSILRNISHYFWRLFQIFSYPSSLKSLILKEVA